MIQKIIKVGNSAALIIPSEFLKATGLRIGDLLDVAYNTKLKMIIARPHNPKSRKFLSPEFLDWLDTFLEEYRPVLNKLKE